MILPDYHSQQDNVMQVTTAHKVQQVLEILQIFVLLEINAPKGQLYLSYVMLTHIKILKEIQIVKYVQLVILALRLQLNYVDR